MTRGIAHSLLLLCLLFWCSYRSLPPVPSPSPPTHTPQLYRATRGVPCLVHCITHPKMAGDVFSVELEPLGYERRPSGEADLRRALWAVLQALQGMHQAGFVHRDVRWPNILREPLQVSEARWPSPPPSARHYLHSAGE